MSEPNLKSDDEWQPRDVFLGLLFVATGILILLFSYLTLQTPLPLTMRAAGWLVGTVFFLLGLNAVFRSLLSRSSGSAESR